MKRRKAAKITLYIAVAGMLGMLVQSCNSARKCGCGIDLNTNYRSHRRHR